MQEIEELYHLYGRRIYVYLLRLSGSADLAAECTQETFCRLLTAIESYRGDSRVVTWLFGVARNVFREEVRRRGRRALPLADEQLQAVPGEGTDPVEQLLVAEQRSGLLALLALLPDSYREVLVLKEFEELSHAEIAQVMGQTPNWVRVTHFRARAKLRELYGERGEESHHYD